MILSKVRAKFLFLASVLMSPGLVLAANHTNPGSELIHKFARVVINPIIGLLFAIALAFFTLGVIRLIAGGSNEEVREKGREHILWGLIGMGLMFAAFAVLRMITNTFGIDQAPIDAFQN